MANRTFVIGVGMTKFDKPGTKRGDYPDWVQEAGETALLDAGIRLDEIEQMFAGYCYGDTTSGQRALAGLGFNGAPIVNVNNACATGSSALYLARQAVKGGLADCALAVGFERMQPGALAFQYPDRTAPLDQHLELMYSARPHLDVPFIPEMFGNAGREHMERYGSTLEHFAWVGYKNHKHSANNPYAQFQTEFSLDDVLGSSMIHDPLTKLQCSAASDGAAAAILASERFVDEHDLWDQAIEIAGQSLLSDLPGALNDSSCIRLVGTDIAREAGKRALDEAQIDIHDVDVIELHDCFSTNEILAYEALGLADEGEGHKLVEEQATTYGGKVVVNPSGGLISKGHPLGATGLAQCTELTWQLRGTADARQIEDAKIGLQHNQGLMGVGVVTVYRKPTST
jgi:acetyl-CoA acyltransferase